jgi:hypothetical protein
MRYRCKWFVIEELVDKETLEKFGEDRCWNLFDDRLLMAADIIREDHGPMIVNNWHVGGSRTESGLRVPGMKHFSPTSQHTYGRALDSILVKAELEAVQIDIVTDRDRYHMITGLEVGPDVTWLHIDTRNSDRLIKFTP